VASVDVAIPSYQYAPFLRDCVMSVLSQEVAELRVLIIDNASTDGSAQIAEDLAAADPRVTAILNDHNRGLHDSCNRAVDWADADYFVLLDADDLLAAGGLAAGVAYLDDHPDVGMLYGVEARLTDGLLDPGRCDAPHPRWNIVTGTEFIRRTCWDSFCDIGAPAVIVRTEAQKKAGYFRESLVRTFDFEMYLRLATVGAVASTNRVLGVRRVHAAQLSTPYTEQPLRDFIEHELAFTSFFAHEGAELPTAGTLEAMSRRKMGDYVYWWALWRFICGKPDAREGFEFAAARRRVANWWPPVMFLFKKRWLRSAWRAVRRMTHKPTPLPPSYRIPKYR
jgi:glycosyltransferase involved in cell wall biosynthesis